MKSKLTLHIDDDVKEATKNLAHERGQSVSAMVEAYFRLLLHDADRGETGTEMESATEKELGPISRRIAGALDADSEAYHGDDKEEDRSIVVRAALEKHGRSVG